jgi:hypothetical protein
MALTQISTDGIKNGTITGSDLATNVDLVDNQKLRFGTSSEKGEIYNDGNDLFINHTEAGYLQLQGNYGVLLQRHNGTENLLRAFSNGSVEIFYDNNKKFETTSSGIDLPTGGSEITFLGSGTCRHSIQSPSGSNDVVITANKLAQNVTANVIFKSSGAGGGSVTEKCRINGNGHFRPGTNNAFDLGTSDYRWRNLYTNDLNLSNEGSSNDVDGTWGSYTIQEGEESLFLINKRNGKKYKFNLTEVS